MSLVLALFRCLEAYLGRPVDQRITAVIDYARRNRASGRLEDMKMTGRPQTEAEMIGALMLDFTKRVVSGESLERAAMDEASGLWTILTNSPTLKTEWSQDPELVLSTLGEAAGACLARAFRMAPKDLPK